MVFRICEMRNVGQSGVNQFAILARKAGVRVANNMAPQLSPLHIEKG
jgi:hypothetical protein